MMSNHRIVENVLTKLISYTPGKSVKDFFFNEDLIT